MQASEHMELDRNNNEAVNELPERNFATEEQKVIEVLFPCNEIEQTSRFLRDYSKGEEAYNDFLRNQREFSYQYYNSNGN